MGQDLRVQNDSERMESFDACGEMMSWPYALTIGGRKPASSRAVTFFFCDVMELMSHQPSLNSCTRL